MTDDAAQALKWQIDAADITAIILENIAGKADAEGRPVDGADIARTAGVLIASAWALAKAGHADASQAAAFFVPVLRSTADTIEALEGGGRGVGGQ